MHGKSLGGASKSADVEMKVSGEDIIKGIMNRVQQIRDKMAQVGSNLKTIERLDLCTPIKNSIGARFAI